MRDSFIDGDGRAAIRAIGYQPSNSPNHPTRMALNPSSLNKPFGKLHKALKHLPKRPSPDAVHDLRTQARRIEAIIHALMLENRKVGERLLKSLAPIRKAAGDVRDIDVMVGFTAALARESDSEGVVELLEYLGHSRVKAAANLHETIVERKKEVFDCLRRCTKSVKEDVELKDAVGLDRRRKSEGVGGASLQLGAALGTWPRLNAGNIHDFRLKVKELLYILDLENHRDQAFLESLDVVKDAIGEWHDWSELAFIANEVIQDRIGHELVRRIRLRAKKALDRALAVTNRMRMKYLATTGPKVGGRRPPVPTNGAGLSAASRLAI